MAADPGTGATVAPTIDTVDLRINTITAFNDYSMAIAKNSTYFIKDENIRTNTESVLDKAAVVSTNIGTYIQNDNVAKSVANLIGSFSFLTSMWNNDIENGNALSYGSNSSGSNSNGTYAGPGKATISSVGKSFPCPVDAVTHMSNNYGDFRSDTGSHKGIDIYVPIGTMVFAVEDGTVSLTGRDNISGWKIHNIGTSGVDYFYCHLLGGGFKVADGVKVRAGQWIATAGESATEGTPHIHFEIHPQGEGGNAPHEPPFPFLTSFYNFPSNITNG